jgi:hypothetical protein
VVTPHCRSQRRRPARSVQGERPADRYLNFLDHLSRITWRIRVAHQLSGHSVTRQLAGGQVENIRVAGSIRMPSPLPPDGHDLAAPVAQGAIPAGPSPLPPIEGSDAVGSNAPSTGLSHHQHWNPLSNPSATQSWELAELLAFVPSDQWSRLMF